MFLNDSEIIEMNEKHNVIVPFNPHQVKVNDQGTKALSSGLSSFGYDVTLDKEKVSIFTNRHGSIIDPKRLDEKSLEQGNILANDYGEHYVILPPNSYMLGCTLEVFDVPRDTVIICLGKSTYARAGIIINVTPIEPGFKGQVVIEIGNQTSLPAIIYLGEGIAQFLFAKGNPCKVSYADRNGKYQGQQSITLPRV